MIPNLCQERFSAQPIWDSRLILHGIDFSSHRLPHFACSRRIIAELEEAGYIEKHKVGRQNHYRNMALQPLRHPIENHRTIGDILELIRDGRWSAKGPQWAGLADFLAASPSLAELTLTTVVSTTPNEHAKQCWRKQARIVW